MKVVYDHTPHLLYPTVYQVEDSELASKRNVPDKLNTVDPIRFVALP